jgi:hypothetical protein
MAALAHLESDLPTVSRRRNRRQEMRLAIGGVKRDGNAIEVTVHDLSVTGLLIESDAALILGDIIYLDVPEAGRIPTEVMWQSGRFCGCQFRREVTNASISAALLKSGFTNSPDQVATAKVIAELPEAAVESRSQGRVSLMLALSALLWALGGGLAMALIH